jgi:hypothetical protein
LATHTSGSKKWIPGTAGRRAELARAKGKPVLGGFELDFSTGMNAGTAGSPGNYTIRAVLAKHGK